MTRTRLLLIATVSLIAFGLNRAGLLPPGAEAATPGSSVREALAGATVGAAKWQARIVTDGGTTGLSNVNCVTSTNQTLQIQNLNDQEYAYKTCLTITCVPNELKDIRVMQSFTTQLNVDGGGDGNIVKASSRTGAPIEMALDKCIAAISLDGGALNMNLYTITGNLRQ